MDKPYPNNDTLCNDCKNWYWCTEDGPNVEECKNYCPKPFLSDSKNIAIDPISSIEEYISKRDWRIAENANMPFSLSNLLLNLSGKLVAEYWLNIIYKDSPIAEMHRKGFVHIHDLGLLSPYCFTEDTTIRLEDGSSITMKELFEKSSNPQVLPQAELRYTSTKAQDHNGIVDLLVIVKYRDKKECIKIVTVDDRIIEVSNDHAVLIKRDDKYLLVRADEISNTDRIICINE